MTTGALVRVDPAVLCRKLTTDLTSMGYSVTAADTQDGFDLIAEKDRTPMDFVLGRQQKLCFSVREREDPSDAKMPYRVECVSRKQARGNRIFCLFFGAFMLGIPWIFCLIARNNANEAMEVGEISVKNVVLKQNAAGAEN